MHILRIQFRTLVAHLGTAFSNNTSKMSSLIPSKSIIRGMLGAALGEDFQTTQHYDFQYSFRWLTSPKSMMFALNHQVHLSPLDFRTLATSDRADHYTIDYVEYLYHAEGDSLEGYIYIVASEEWLARVRTALYAPHYPIFLGKSQSFLKIVDIVSLESEITFDTTDYAHFFIGKSEAFQLTERLTDKMRDYRTPDTLESVYSLAAPIKGTPTYGAIVDDERGETLALW